MKETTNNKMEQNEFNSDSDFDYDRLLIDENIKENENSINNDKEIDRLFEMTTNQLHYAC